MYFMYPILSLCKNALHSTNSCRILKKIFIFCGHKAVRIVSNTIVKNTIGDVIKDEKYPEGICETCRRKANPQLIVDWSINNVKVNTRSNQNCDCDICERGRKTGPSKRKPGPKTVCGPELIKRTCLKCLSVIGRGLSHKCINTTLRVNMTGLVSEKPSVAEQFATELIQNKVTDMTVKAKQSNSRHWGPH